MASRFQALIAVIAKTSWASSSSLQAEQGPERLCGPV